MAKDPVTVTTNRRILLWSTATAVALLAGAGFTLSFSSLIDLAALSGIDRQLAFLWPLIVDGFIVVATAAAFALKGRSRRVTWYPWTALIFFSAISVIGNAVHATQVADVHIPIALATAVSSIPAIALLVATHLLVVMVDAHTSHTAVPAPSSKRPAAPSSDRQLVAAIQAAGKSGQPVTGKLVASLAGTSVRTGRRRLAVLREQFPNQLQKQTDTVEGA
ncbi:DUF2637 domain-containing protein [Planctomonas sp. JC2975]|uniref:DUF2637 domain-containing protein n=1 Tax=Planctomonas sp. JC2975 TaxID=2729626 RepID=UPI0014762C71|nr:DUF2637 domain-containing protein [Planctomonas sp. JC2975]NNC12832.1 DUF2637 domain-containing protein [Planctomonas sp. JC2975]